MHYISSAPKRIPNRWSKNTVDSRNGGQSEKIIKRTCRTEEARLEGCHSGASCYDYKIVPVRPVLVCSVDLLDAAAGGLVFLLTHGDQV